LAQAHAPDVSSTILVQQKDGTWVLQIRSALIAFEQEINNRYGLNAYDTPEEFMNLVIEHLQENLNLTFNEKEDVKLTKGLVKLGHETNVLFTVLNVPENFNTLSVKNSSFKNIHRSQSALIIFKEGFEKQQFVLNGRNNYTATLEVNKSNFELKK